MILFGAKAKDINGNESVIDYENEYSAAVAAALIDNTGIAKPEIFDVVGYEDYVSIEWEETSDDDLGYYIVEQIVDGEYVEAAKTTNKTGVVVNNLKSNTAYTFRVVGYDNLGNRGTVSDDILISTSNDETIPVISKIESDGQYYNKSIDVYISVTDNVGVDRVEIAYSYDKEKWYDLPQIKPGVSQTKWKLSYSIDSTQFMEGYVYVKFIAFDEDGNASDEVVENYIIDHQAPKEVDKLVADGSSGYISLRWNEVDSDIQRYDIYRSVYGRNIYSKINSCETVSFDDKNCEYGVTYSYKIKAVDRARNESGYSNETIAKRSIDTEAPVVYGVSPTEGKRISGEVTFLAMADDNVKLKDVVFSYKAADTREDIWTEIGTVSSGFDEDYPKITFNVGQLESKEYLFRVIATDIEGNVSNIYTTKYIVDNVAPESVTLTATSIGYGVQLSWNGCSDDDFAGYELYRLSPGESEFQLIATPDGVSYKDTQLKAGENYQYKIVTIDQAGNRSESEIVSVTPKEDDIESPVAKANVSASVREGEELVLDASKSSDNVKIIKYEWELGNGDTKTGKKVKYVYDKKGTYYGKLTVTDKSGNVGVTSFTVKVRARNSAQISIKVIESEEAGTNALSDVYISVTGGQVKDEMYTTDEIGSASMILKPGKYEASVYKAGYSAEKVTFTVDAGDDKEIKVRLAKGGIISGTLTQRRLTIDEIKELGVDIKDENNWYSYEITYVRESNVHKERIDVDEDGNFSCGSGKGKITRYYDQEIVTITEVKEYFKKMYEFNLTVMNTSSSGDDFVIKNSNATLKLPQGLSFVNTAVENNSTVSLGDLAGQQTETVAWYIKADEPNTYEVSASVNGTLMPFNIPVNETIKADPFTVTEEEDNTFTDSGFITGTAHDYSIYVKDAAKNENVKGAHVMLIASNGMKCDTITNSDGQAKLYVNENEDRVFTLQIDYDDKEEVYVDYSYAPDISEYEDCIKINDNGNIPNDEHKIQLTSATLNGKNIYCEEGCEINCRKSEMQYFKFEFEEDITEYKLYSGNKILSEGEGDGQRIDLGYQGNIFKVNKTLKLKVEAVVDGKTVSETYNFGGYITVVDYIYYRITLDGMGNTIDVMRERKVLNQHFRNRQITITAKPEDDIDVAKSELIQDGEKIAESKDGIFKIVIGNLKCKRDIFIVSYDGNGEFMEKRMLNIAVNPDPEDEGTSWSMCGGGIGIQSLIGEDKLPRWIRGMQVTQKFPNKVIMLATHEFTDDYYTIGAEAIYNETSGAGSFDFEVGANFKVFDAEEITEGQVYLDSEVEVEYQNQCMVAGIPMVFSTGFSLNGKHSGKAILINSMPDFSIDGQEKAGAELKFGVGVANVISSGIYGGINAEVDWYLTKELGIGVDKIEASGSVGFYLEIVDFEYKEGYDIVPCTIYDKYGNSKKVSVRRMNANSINSIFSSSNNETSDDIQITDEDNYKSASREYLNERSEWDGENKSAVNDIMTLQSSAYTNAKPKVISCNGVTMMLFNDDDETRTDNNRSKLVYSIFNPETKSWSEPVAVNDDGTADYGFDVYDNGKNIYIVWQNADASLDGENSLSDVANHLGISVAKYDCSSGKMISLGNVEGTFNDNQCQAEPKIACHNGEVYVCWYENSENNIFGASGTNTIYYSKLQEENSAAIKIGETQKMITSMDIGIMQNKVYVSYSTGMLETDETESENSIYIVNVSGDESEKTDIPTDSGTNLIFTKYNGNDILSWYENGNIKYISSLNEQSEKMFEEDEIYVNDYSFVSDGDNSSILYSSTKDNKAQAYVINYNNSLGKWDKIVELTNQDKYIENVSGTYADGHLILTFNQTEANIEGENIDLKKSICCMNVEPETKMIIECVKYDQDVIPGGNVELTVNVRNAGMNTIDMARLVVNDSKGKQYATKDFDAMLLSGEAGDYNVKITMPYTLESDEYTFSLYNGDTLCDSYVETLGYADLSVSRRIFNRCGNYSVQADITNNGIEKSSGKVVFYDYNDESNVYYTKAFDELAYEDEVSIVYNVPEELVSDNQKCVIGVKVISDREQKNTENDVVIATINSVTEKSLCIVQFEDVESKTNVIKYTNSEGKISEFPEIPTKEGYVFEGWYREKEKVDVNTVFNNDTVVTAKWSEKLSDKQKEEEDIGQGIAKPIEEETTMKTPEQPNTVMQLPNKTDDGVKRDDKLPRVKERGCKKSP